MGFNLQLLHSKNTKHQLLEAWKQGMEEVAGQGLSAQVVRALFCTKKLSDVITKKFKAYGRKFNLEKFNLYK
jgi:hypothetical protein